MQKLQRHSNQAIIAPGVILGLKVGSSLEPGWAVFSDADGKFLKGTDSDVTVGTSDARSEVFMAVATSGMHSGSGSQDVINRGHHLNDTSAPARNPSREYSDIGDHDDHLVPIDYRPGSSDLKLIQSTRRTKLPAGVIGFSLVDMPDQAPFSTFNGNGKLLAAASVTGTTEENISADTTTSSSTPHVHDQDKTWRAGQNRQTVRPQEYSTEGSGHTHPGGVPVLTPNLKKVLLRAWEVVSPRKITGLVGMFIGAGVPAGWELVTECVGYYVELDANGSGGQSGDNTIEIIGTTGDDTHAHTFSNFSGTSWNFSSYIYHADDESHTHSYGDTVSFEPERYHVKFIKYVG